MRWIAATRRTSTRSAAFPSRAQEGMDIDPSYVVVGNSAALAARIDAGRGLSDGRGRRARQPGDLRAEGALRRVLHRDDHHARCAILHHGDLGAHRRGNEPFHRRFAVFVSELQRADVDRPPDRARDQERAALEQSSHAVLDDSSSLRNVASPLALGAARSALAPAARPRSQTDPAALYANDAAGVRRGRNATAGTLPIGSRLPRARSRCGPRLFAHCAATDPQLRRGRGASPSTSRRSCTTIR